MQLLDLCPFSIFKLFFGHFEIFVPRVFVFSPSFQRLKEKFAIRYHSLPSVYCHSMFSCVIILSSQTSEIGVSDLSRCFSTPQMSNLHFPASWTLDRIFLLLFYGPVLYCYIVQPSVLFIVFIRSEICTVIHIDYLGRSIRISVWMRKVSGSIPIPLLGRYKWIQYTLLLHR